MYVRMDQTHPQDQLLRVADWPRQDVVAQQLLGRGEPSDSRKQGLQFADSPKDIAPWIHPTIWALCKELETPAGAPHILAGVTTILALPSPSLGNGGENQREDKKDKIPALIAAVYFYVRTRLSGCETSGQEYVSQRNGVLSTLSKLKKVKEGLELEGWENVGTNDIDIWILEISNHGWLKLDWFENIVEGAGLEVKEGNGQHEKQGESHLRTAKNGRNEAVRDLLDPKDLKTNRRRRRSGSTPLLLAASNGDEAILRLLLQQGDINPDSRGHNGDTPLICAARKGHKGVVQLLLDQRGVDADANNEANQTPLWCAAENGHDSIVRLLLDLDDVDPNTEDEDGWTPLMMAAHNGHESVLQRLLQRKDVDSNSKDENGWTPLMIAADKGHGSVVQILLQRQDVDPNPKDAIGWTPLMIAAYNGHESVVRLLQDVYRNSQSVDGSLLFGEESTNSESRMSHLQLDTSGRFIQTINERMFDDVKHKLAYDFLSELDNKVCGGQIASKTARGGGVKITWSKKSKTTVGQANWTREKITCQSSEDASCQSVMYRHKASIDLSEKVIDNKGMCTPIFRE
jgi:ankyrin repeat protein